MQPRRLLASVDGLTLIEMDETEVCCGFGGAFSVKYPDISNAIVERQGARTSPPAGADCLLAGDLGCLMHIAGKLSRDGSKVECRHVAEVLAGMTDDAGHRASAQGGVTDGKRTSPRLQAERARARSPTRSCSGRCQRQTRVRRQARRAQPKLPEFDTLRDEAAPSRTTRWRISTSISKPTSGM